MSLKVEFDNAYSMLCDKLYKQGGYCYKEIQGKSDEAEELIDDLIEMKIHADSKMKYLIRTIYKELNIKYER